MDVECFRVIEAGEGIEETILRRLALRGGMGGRCVSGGHPALLVVSPGAVRRGLELPDACRTVLLPGYAEGALRGLRAAGVVRYGTSPSDSLTLSGRERDRVWAQLRREIVTVGGHVVQRQKFPVALPAGSREMPALAAAGALLLLGVSPAELDAELDGENAEK